MDFVYMVGRPEVVDFGGLGSHGSPKNHSSRRGRSPPLFGMVFPAAGAAQTQQVDNFLPAQKPCSENPSVYGAGLRSAPRNGSSQGRGFLFRGGGSLIRGWVHTQRDPEVFLLAKCFCWRPGVPRPNKQHNVRKNGAERNQNEPRSPISMLFRRDCVVCLWTWLQLMWLSEVRPGSFGVDLGPVWRLLDPETRICPEHMVYPGTPGIPVG